MFRFFFDLAKRLTESYPEIYGSGTSEGSEATGYFEKWGWIASIDELCKGKRWKWEYFLNMNVYEFHLTLAHKLDKDKMKARVRQKAINKR